MACQQRFVPFEDFKDFDSNFEWKFLKFYIFE